MVGAWTGQGSGLTCKVRAGATEDSRGTGLYPEIRGEGWVGSPVGTVVQQAEVWTGAM